MTNGKAEFQKPHHSLLTQSRQGLPEKSFFTIKIIAVNLE
jgi:hypothetical protein